MTLIPIDFSKFYEFNYISSDYMNSKKKSARNAGERHKSSTISSADPTSISKCNQVHGKNIQQVNRENTAE